MCIAHLYVSFDFCLIFKYHSLKIQGLVEVDCSQTDTEILNECAVMKSTCSSVSYCPMD